MSSNVADLDRSAFSDIEDALDDVRAGKFVVVIDTADPHREGGLTIAAGHATPAAVNFLLTYARGPLYLCLSDARCAELGLTSIAGASPRSGAAFMMSIEAREGISSGVSTNDRSRTIRLAADPSTQPNDLAYPGHVQVLRALPGGVLARARQTEAAVDLAQLAGLAPAGVVAEILKPDGTMAVVADLVEYCTEHGIRLVTISDLVTYRRSRERLVERIVSVRMPTAEHGEFTAIGYREVLTGEEHIALVKGDIDNNADTLVRVHTQCLLGDVLHSTYCDCGDELGAALAMIERAGGGVVLYMSRPGRGMGLLRRMARAAAAAPSLVSRADDEPADARDYGIGNQILADLGVRRLRLLTDNARELPGLESYGLTLVDQVPLRSAVSEPGVTRLHHQDLSID